MTMEKQQSEDVSPIENGDVFGGGMKCQRHAWRCRYCRKNMMFVRVVKRSLCFNLLCFVWSLRERIILWSSNSVLWWVLCISYLPTILDFGLPWKRQLFWNMEGYHRPAVWTHWTLIVGVQNLSKSGFREKDSSWKDICLDSNILDLWSVLMLFLCNNMISEHIQACTVLCPWKSGRVFLCNLRCKS